MGLGRAASLSSRAARRSPGQTTDTLTTTLDPEIAILFLTFSKVSNQLRGMFRPFLENKLCVR